MERYYQMSSKELKKLENKIDSLDNYYRIRNQDKNMGRVLFKLYEKQQEEIAQIKKKIEM